MRAIVVNSTGDLVIREVPDPVVGPGEVLLRVFATAVNRADLLQARGLYPAPAGESAILGLEAAGVIEGLGAGVVGWEVGDGAAALLSGGGYAELVAVPAGQLLPIPEDYSPEDAAALPEVLATAWLNLFSLGGAKAGDYALIHAGASGVGTAAIQLCRSRGVRAFVTAGSDEKLAFCHRLGALDGALRGRFAGQVEGWTRGHRFDLILDPVGGAYLEDNLASLAVDGRLLLIGILGGNRANIDLGRLLVKRQRLIGSTLRSRSREEKAKIIADLRREVWPLVERGELVPIVDRILPLERAGEAHALLAQNATIGKIVLTVGDDDLSQIHED